MQKITWWLEFFYVDVKKDCNKSTHQNICEENNYRVDLFVPTMLRDEYIDKRKSAHIAKKNYDSALYFDEKPVAWNENWKKCLVNLGVLFVSYSKKG